MLMAAVSPALLLDGSTRYEPLEYRVPPVEPNPGDSLYSLLRNLPEYEVSPKYAETVRLVHANASEGRKTLVWSNFIRSISTLEVLLAPYGPATVHGGTLDREDQLKRFREDSDCMVLLSNPATLGEGISLHQVCHDAVYVDRDFTAGRYLQSLDRIHRLGLSHETETNVTILAARNTIDAVVADRLERKLEFMGKILDDPSVQRLGDLEEVSGAAGMDATDIATLLAHLAEQRSARA
jgi:SNF2 family DNA or RNA helicase